MNAPFVVAACLVLAMCGAVGFAIDYAVVGQTQIAAIALGVACASFAAALVVWEHALMPHPESTQEMPSLRSSESQRSAEATSFADGMSAIVGTRSWLLHLLAAASGVVGIALLFPLRSLTPTIRQSLERTSWTAGARLVTEDGVLVKASDLAVNSVLTVFPEGHTGAAHRDEMANAATMLVRVPPEELELPAGRSDWAPEGLVAYSKVCTHAGCPVALYRAAARELFCPCHQSTFDVLRGGKPVFGPAARALPQLPLRIAADGVLEAKSDFPEAIGPGSWDRA